MTRVATLTDGTAVAMPDIMAYTHPGVDATHNTIFAPSVVQAAGRVGQFHRTPDNTCVTYIVNVIMDRPMTSIRPWEAVRPGPGAAGDRDRQGGWAAVACTPCTRVSTAPSVRPTCTAGARTARSPTSVRVCLRSSRSDTVPWFSVMAQAAGQGHKPEEFFFRRGTGEDLRPPWKPPGGALVMWEVTQVTRYQVTEVLRSQLHQDLTRPVRSTSPDWGEATPPWMAEGGETAPEQAHGPPDG